MNRVAREMDLLFPIHRLVGTIAENYAWRNAGAGRMAWADLALLRDKCSSVLFEIERNRIETAAGWSRALLPGANHEERCDFYISQILAYAGDIGHYLIDVQLDGTARASAEAEGMAGMPTEGELREDQLDALAVHLSRLHNVAALLLNTSQPFA